jgi:hypothetical protein
MVNDLKKDLNKQMNEVKMLILDLVEKFSKEIEIIKILKANKEILAMKSPIN